MARSFVIVAYVWAVLHLVVVFVLSPVVPEDDAFITYQYAANLVEGNGFTFNPGERVLGTSSPAYAVVLALPAWVAGRDALPRAAVLLNGLLLLFTAFAAFRVLQALGVRPQLRYLAPLWILLVPRGLSVGLTGMEAYLFGTLFFAAAWSAAAHRWPLAGFLATGAVLARPEAAVLVVALAAAWWFRGRPSARRTVFVAVSVVVSWCIFAGLYFGSPVPQSVSAKASGLYRPPALHAAEFVARSGADWLVSHEGAAARVAFWLTMPLLLLAAGVEARERSRASAVRAALLVLPVATTGLFVLGNPMWCEWYGPPLLLPWATAVVIGLDTLARRLNPARFAAAAVGWVLAGVVIPLLIGSVTAMWRPGWPATTFGVISPYRLRVVPLAMAGAALSRELPAQTEVLAVEVGALRYYLQGGRVIDGCALTGKDAMPYLPVACQGSPEGGSIPVGLVVERRPGLIVSYPQHLICASERPWFNSAYRTIAVIPIPDLEFPMYNLQVLRATGLPDR